MRNKGKKISWRSLGRRPKKGLQVVKGGALNQAQVTCDQVKYQIPCTIQKSYSMCRKAKIRRMVKSKNQLLVLSKKTRQTAWAWALLSVKACPPGRASRALDCMLKRFTIMAQQGRLYKMIQLPKQVTFSTAKTIGLRTEWVTSVEETERRLLSKQVTNLKTITIVIWTTLRFHIARWREALTT